MSWELGVSVAISSVLVITGLIYTIWVIWVIGGLKNLPKGGSSTLPNISLIIPARDEEALLPSTLESIANQDYPAELLEIVLVNDRSKDATGRIMREWAKAQKASVKLVEITKTSLDMAPKKNAVTQGMKEATGEIVVTTDADTHHNYGWLKGLMKHFEPEVGLVAGLTIRTPKKNIPIWQMIDTVDFLSHAIMSAGAIGKGTAYTCIASNLAYRRSAFEEVGGFYSEIGTLISGDDDLLIQRINTHTSWKIRFATERETFVTTTPPDGIRGMIHQRVRWASKGSKYRSDLSTMLVNTFLFYLLLAITLPLSLTGWAWMATATLAWPMWGLKVAVDSWAMWRGCARLGISGVFRYVWVAQLVHVPMILVAAFLGHTGTFLWKGSTYSRSVGNPQRFEK